MSKNREHRQFSAIAASLSLVFATVGWWWTPALFLALAVAVGFMLGHVDGRRVGGAWFFVWERGNDRRLRGFNDTD